MPLPCLQALVVLQGQLSLWEKMTTREAQKILGNCFSVLMMFAVVLTVVFYIFAPQLLRLFGASDVTLPYGLSYARIYILGTVLYDCYGHESFYYHSGICQI